MTDFGPDLGNVLTAYPAVDLEQTLPMVLAGRQQLYIAEKEKFAHVTYFFNGGYANPVAGEDRLVIPSPKVSSYDKTPAMAVYKITAAVIKKLADYQFICINFAIPDMVAHTGNLAAGVKSVEAIDRCLKKLKQAVIARQGILIITSDHGNADCMLDVKTQESYTEHTKNPVPLIVIGPGQKKRKLKRGRLSDIAPTILKLLAIKKPRAMTGQALF